MRAVVYLTDTHSIDITDIYKIAVNDIVRKVSFYRNGKTVELVAEFYFDNIAGWTMDI